MTTAAVLERPLRAPLELDDSAVDLSDAPWRPASSAGLGRSTFLFDAIRPLAPAPRRTRSRRARPGNWLGGYRLIEKIGRGAHGEVWKAARRDDPGCVPVALKVLSPAETRDPRRLAQLRDEAAVSRRVEGPHLLSATDFAEDSGFAFLAMPLVDGYTLREVIVQRKRRLAGRLPLADHWRANADEPVYIRSMTRVLARIARALQSVHDARVAHRDVKPANILIHRYCGDRVYLADFGLARDLAAAPSRNEVRDSSGTPRYMAPEKLLGGDVDEVRGDIYALGITLFEALTLAHPIAVPKTLPRSCLASYLASTEPRLPRDLRPTLPEALEAIILRAMRRQPSQRYATAADLAEDLERFLLRGVFGYRP